MANVKSSLDVDSYCTVCTPEDVGIIPSPLLVPAFTFITLILLRLFWNELLKIVPGSWYPRRQPGQFHRNFHLESD